MRRRCWFAALATLICVGFVWRAHADDDEDLQKAVEELQKQGAGGLTESASPEKLKEIAQTVLTQVSKTRELPIKRPVAMEVASREQIVGYVDGRMQEELKPNELAGQEAALKRLGLVPEKMNMKKFLLDLYGEQVAGYYDPFKQKFIIASWMSPLMQTPIMAHELTHALQDQAWNLKPFLSPIADNSDATSARQAVAEGDAVLSMFAFLGQPLGDDAADHIRGQMGGGSTSQYPVFQAAPPYFQEALLFPYADGAGLARAAFKKSGWKGVNNLYVDLPKSSEQVLHPTKYFDARFRDDPKPVALPMKLDGFREIHTDVLGELVIRTMLRAWLPEADADKAAMGWGGDRYRAFQPAKSKNPAAPVMIVLRSTWDTAPDAEEYAAAWRALLPKKYAGTKTAADTSGTTFTTIEDGLARVELNGKDVVVVDAAPDSATLAVAMKAAWGAAPGKP